MVIQKKIIWVSLLVILVDQLVKQLVVHAGIRFTSPVFAVSYVQNRGSLWGLFSGPLSNVIFIILSFFALGFLYYYVTKYLKPKETIPFAILLGGIIGNLVDRIIYGFVIDWVNLYWWPVFNIADMGISIGVALLVFFSLQEEYVQLKKKKIM